MVLYTIYCFWLYMAAVLCVKCCQFSLFRDISPFLRSSSHHSISSFHCARVEVVTLEGNKWLFFFLNFLFSLYCLWKPHSTATTFLFDQQRRRNLLPTTTEIHYRFLVIVKRIEFENESQILMESILVGAKQTSFDSFLLRKYITFQLAWKKLLSLEKC